MFPTFPLRSIDRFEFYGPVSQHQSVPEINKTECEYHNIKINVYDKLITTHAINRFNKKIPEEVV